MPPSADLLVRRLSEQGVRHVFGYPGGQLTPVYDALYRQPGVRHVLARHEQAAAFMADGYARATGEPGVSLAVCGPGVFNAFTSLATAHADSIPVLLISGQVPGAGRGLRSGYYHENDQLTASVPVTKARFRAETPGEVVPLLDRAWQALTTGRPGPVLFEVPVDVLRAEAPPSTGEPTPGRPPRQEPDADGLLAVAALLTSWHRPLILAGGGVVSANASLLLADVAERLGAPVFHTSGGKTALPGSHPLAAGMPWRRATSDLSNMTECFSPLFREADGILAVGCRFTQLATGSWTLPIPALAQIDIDPEEIGRHYPVKVGLVGDANAALTALLNVLPRIGPRTSWAPPEPRQPWRLPGMDLAGPIERALPADGIVAADITRLAYILMGELRLERPRSWLHPAGSVAMGYALPAALGAKAAFPDRPVLAVVGDGGFQMSALELASAVQERLPVVVLLVNDSCLTLIKATQQRRYAERYIGVDLRNPDFEVLARAFGVRYWRPQSEAALEQALREALAAREVGLVEVRPS
jgi:acetolactate synthase-1/2/3 large subunit